MKTNQINIQTRQMIKDGQPKSRKETVVKARTRIGGSQNGIGSNRNPHYQVSLARQTLLLMLALLFCCTPAVIAPTSADEVRDNLTLASLDDGIGNRGEIVTSSLTITHNPGNRDSVAMVEVTIPGNFSGITNIISPNHWALTVGSNRLTWEAQEYPAGDIHGNTNVAYLPPGESITFSWDYTLPTGVAAGGDYPHSWRTVSSLGNEQTGQCDFHVRAPAFTASDLWAIDGDANIVTNGDASHYVDRGEIITYSFEITNTGDMDASGVEIVSAVPPEKTFYVTSSTQINGSTISDVSGDCPLRWRTPVQAPGSAGGVIPAGESAVITTRVQTDPNLWFERMLTLDANVYSNAGEETTLQFSGPVVHGAPPTISDTGPSPVLSPLVTDLGEQVTYTLTVPQAATDTDSVCYVELILPAGFTNLASVVSPPGWADQSVGDRIAWSTSFGNCIEPGGSAQFQLTATSPVGVGNGGDYSFTWRANTSSSAEWTGTFDIHINEPDINSPQITLIDENGGLLQRGDFITYRLVVINTGDMDTDGARFRAPVPPNQTSYVDGSTMLNGSPVSDNRAISRLRNGFQVKSSGAADGVIAIGDSAVVTTRVQVLPNARFGQRPNLRMYVTSNTGHGGQDETASPPISALPANLTFAGPGPDSPCVDLPYTITIESEGPGAAFDAYSIVTIPAGFVYVNNSGRASSPGGLLDPYNPTVIGNLLYFNHDGASPNPGNDPVWDIPGGEELEITFDLRAETCVPGPYNLTATGWVREGEYGETIEIYPNQTVVTVLNEAILSIAFEPPEPEAEVGETVSWDIRLKATGLADVPMIRLVDELDPGLTYDPTNTSPLPTLVETLPGDITRLTWDSTTPGFANLAVGQSLVIALSAVLNSCENYNQTATANWGCSPTGPCQTITALGSVTLMLDEPEIAIAVNPNPIHVPPCSTEGVPVTITVNNTGGEAHDLIIEFEHPSWPLTVTNVSGAVFTPGPMDQFDVGDVTGTQEITFTLVHNHNCALPSGRYILQPIYSNNCDVEFSAPPVTGRVVTDPIPNLSLGIGSTIEVQAGDIEQYIVDLSYPGGPPPSDVTLTVTYPLYFEFLGVTAGQIVPDTGAGQGSLASTWYLAPGEFAADGTLAIEFELQANEDDCGNDDILSAVADMSVNCGDAICEKHASAALPIANDCPLGLCEIYFHRTVNGNLMTTVEPCGELHYENVIDFGNVPETLMWDEITFVADAANDQIFMGYKDGEGNIIPGRIEVVMEELGSTCTHSFIPERDAQNRISLSFDMMVSLVNTESCDPGGHLISPRGAIVTLRYVMVAPHETGMFFDFGRLLIDQSDGTFTVFTSPNDPGDCNGLVAEPVEITVNAATMDVNLILPTMVDACAMAPGAAIEIIKRGPYSTYDNVLYLGTEGFEYIDDPDDPGFFESRFFGLPDVGVPTRVDDDGRGNRGVMWKLGDIEPGFVSGRIEIPLRKRCGDDNSSSVRLVYDNLCENDDTDNIAQNAAEVYKDNIRPDLIRSGDVTYFLTPENVFADDAMVTWILYITNGGSGAAYNVRFNSSQTGDGISFLSAKLYDTDNNEVTNGFRYNPEPGGGKNADGWIRRIPAGETWSVVIEGLTNECSGLVHHVSGNWGCLGEICQDGEQMQSESTVSYPTAEVAATLLSGQMIDHCDPTQIVAQVKNASLAKVFEPIIRFSLPSGLQYIGESTILEIHHTGGITIPSIIDPTGPGADPKHDGNDLVWEMKNYLTEDFLSPEDRVVVKFNVKPSSDFENGTLSIGGTYRTPCGEDFYIVPDNPLVTVKWPTPEDFSSEIMIDPIVVCSPGIEGDNIGISWLNNGSTVVGPAKLTLELPPGIRYRPHTTTLRYPTDSGIGTITADPSQSGNGNPNNPYLLEWSIPSEMIWEAGGVVSLGAQLYNPSGMNCEKFSDNLPFKANLTVRLCDDLDRELQLDTVTQPVQRLAGIPLLDLVSVDLTPNGTLAAGDELEVIATITNVGNARLNNARFDLLYPDISLDWVSATPVPNRDIPSGKRWNSSFVRLRPGDSETIQITFRVRDDILPGQAIEITGRYQDTCCDFESVKTEILMPGGTAGLEIQLISSEALIVPGEPIAFDLTINNTGAQTLKSIEVDITPSLPGLTFSDSDYDGTRVDFTGTGAAPAWEIAGPTLRSLAAGESEEIRLIYTASGDASSIGTPPGSGSLTATARIIGATNVDGDPLTNPALLDEDSETVEVGSRAAMLDIQVVPSTATVIPGEDFTYLVTVTNTGRTELTDVGFIVPVPPGFTYRDYNADEEVVGPTGPAPLIFTIPTLGVDTSKLVAINFQTSTDPSLLNNPVTMMLSASGVTPSGAPVFATMAEASSPVRVPGTGLIVYKLANTAVVIPGWPVVYTVYVVNTGDQDLFNIDVVDVLPPGFLLVDANLPTGVSYWSPSPLTYRVGELRGGQGISFGLTCMVAGDVTLLSNPSINTLNASGTDQAGETVTAPEFDLALPLAMSQAGLDIEMTPAEPVVIPGDTHVFFLTVTNRHYMPITNVEVTNHLPSQLSLINANFDGDITYTPGVNPVFNIASLAPYSSKKIGIISLADPDYTLYPGSGILSNYAEATGEQFGHPVYGDDVTTALLVLPKGSGFMLAKVNPEPEVVAGTQTTYLITVTNTGTQHLTDLEIVDSPQANLIYSSSQLGPRVTLGGTSPLTFDIASLPVHASEIISVTFDVAYDPQAGWTSAQNEVSGTAIDEGGVTIGSGPVTNQLPVVWPGAGLKLDKKPTQGEIVPGGTATYIITLENNGDLEVSDITITESMVPGLTYSFANTGPGVTEIGTNPPTFGVASLAPGATGTVTLTFDASENPADFIVPVMNFVTASGSDPAELPVVAIPDTTYLPLSELTEDLDIQKVATDDRIVPGERINYLITVTNTSDQELFNLTVTDSVPDGLTLSQSEFDGDGDVTVISEVPPVYEISSLKPNDATMLSLIFEVSNDPALINDPTINKASVSGFTVAETRVDAIDDYSTLPLLPQPGSIDVEKVSVESPFTAGGLGHYIITVTNTSSVPLTSVEVTDLMGPGLTYVDAEPAPNIFSPTSYGWQFTGLEPGESHTIILSVGVDYSLHGQTVDNTATAIGTTPSLIQVSDVDLTTTPCLAEDSSIHVEKLANETRLVMGGQVSYHILVSNDGSLPLSSVTVRDTIPDGLSFVNADFDDQMMTLVSTNPFVQIDFTEDLEPTSMENITLFFDSSREYADYNLAPGDSTVVNPVAVEGWDPKEEMVTDHDTAELDLVSPRAAIQVHYAHTTSQIIPGQVATYLVTIENIGDQVLDDVWLSIPDLTVQGLEYESSNFDIGEVAENHISGFQRWQLLNPLRAGAAEQIRITYLAATNIANMASVINSTASVTAVDEDDNPVGDDADESVPLSPKRGAVSIDNTAADGKIMPGELVTYHLTIQAGAELDLVDLVVDAQDLTASGLELYQVNYDTNVFNRPSDFRFAAPDTFRAGHQEEIRLTYRADEDVNQMPATVDMLAEVEGYDIYGRPVSDNDPESLPVLLPESHLLVEKVALASAVVPGETITYFLTVTNNGNQDLSDLLIQDRLPDQMTTFASYFDSSRVTFTGHLTDPSWELMGILEPGESFSMRLLATTDPDPSLYGDTITNTVEASASDEEDNQLTANDFDTLPVHNPDIAVDIAKIPNQNLIVPGEAASYVLLIQNVGRVDLEHSVVTEDVPAGLTYQSSIFDTGNVTLTQQGTDVVWEIGLLEPGRATEIQVFFDVSEDPTVIANPVVNLALVESTGPGQTAATDLATASLPVQEAVPDILIEKRATTSVAQPGQLLEYVIEVTNNGNQTLTGITVTDTLITGLTYNGVRFDSDRVSDISPGDALRAYQLTGDFEPGDRRSIYLSALLEADFQDPSNTVVNTAYAVGYAPGELMVSDESTETLPLVGAGPRITVQKFTDTAVAKAGEELLYTIQVTNTGNRDIASVTIEEDLPTNVEYVRSVFDPGVVDEPPTFNRTTPTWKMNRGLKIGATETITVRLRVPIDYDGSIYGDPIENWVHVEAIDVYGDVFSDSDFEKTPVADPNPALNLDVLATSGVIVPGEIITYLVSLTNIGDQDLQDVAVADTLPHGFTVHSTDYDPLHVTETRTTVPFTTGYTTNDRQYIVWSMESLPVAAIEQMRISCLVTENTSELGGPTVKHTLTASGQDVMDHMVYDTDSDELMVAAPGSAISIAKTAVDGDIVPGELVSYILTVRNAGATDLHDARVTDGGEMGLIYKQSSFDNMAVSFAGAQDDSVSWAIASLPVGGFEQIRITYRATSDVMGNIAVDTLQTEAWVTALDPSSSTVTDRDFESLPIHPERSSVQILKESDFSGEMAKQGTEIAYHVRVHNTGDQDLSPVSIVDHLPRGLRYLSADIAPDSVATDATETRIYWSLEILSHVDMWEVMVKARVDTLLVNGAIIETRANVTGLDERGDQVFDTDICNIQAGLPVISIDKNVNHPVANPGEQLTYTITYRNSGNVDADNVVVTDILPDRMTYVSGSATGGAYYEPRFNSITRAVSSLEIDRGAIFSYQVVLDSDAENGLRIPNTATVYADGITPAESDTAWVRVEDKAAELVKVVDRTVAKVGDELTYTLYYHNLSENDYAAVVITDPVPSEVDYISGSASDLGVFDPGTRLIRWDVGALPAGHVGLVTFQAQIRSEARVTGRVTNDGLMVADDQTIPSNKAVTLIVEDVGVSIIKSVNLDRAIPGDTLIYTMVVENVGHQPLTSIRIDDPVPHELTYLPDTDTQLLGADPPTYYPNSRSLQWDVVVMEPGNSTTLQFEAVVNQGVRSGTMVTNFGTVQTNETEPVVSNPANTLIQYPELEIDKTPDRTQVVVGEEVTYTVTVNNMADGVTDSTWVTDVLPAGFTYVAGSTIISQGDQVLSEADPTVSQADEYHDRQQLNWTLGRLGAYAEITVSYRALITGTAGPGWHDNYAIVCGITQQMDELCTDPAIASIEVVVPSLTITKTTTDRAVDPGDIVLYQLKVQNNSIAPVVDLEVRDNLPTGFQIMPGSSTINGVRVDDPITYANGLPATAVAGPMGLRSESNVVVWEISELAGSAELMITYVTVIGLNASSGVAWNRAEAVGFDMGAGKVAAGPAEARVFVLDDELPGRLRGRVIVDCDGDGKPDTPQERTLHFSASGKVVDEAGNVVGAGDDHEIKPYENIEILVEDGRRVRTNHVGEFFIYPLQWGDHVAYLDQRSLEEGTSILGDDSQFFTVLEGGEARIDFRICPPPPKRGSIQLIKTVEPEEVIAVRRVIEPEVFTLEGVYFDTGKAILKPEASHVLAEAAKRIIEDPTAEVRIEGHTDIRPIKTKEFPDNYALSDGRAAVVKQALGEMFSVDTSRFTTAGFGPDHPVAPNTTAHNLSLNRRTEIILLPSVEEIDAGSLFTPSTVTFTVKVVYEGSFSAEEGAIRDAFVYDEMSYGLEYLLGTTIVNGQPADDPELMLGDSTIEDDELVEGNRKLVWKLGTIYPGDVIEIEYETTITDVPANSLKRNNIPVLRTDDTAAHIARVDGLLRDPEFRKQGHLWENKAWFEGVRAEAEFQTEAAGADLKLSFEKILEPIRITLDDVLFDTGKANLRPEAYGVLNPAAEIIRSRVTSTVRIEGHTDIRPINNEEFPSNQELSDARAKAVIEYFVDVERLDRDIFSSRGFGPRRPIADNDTPAGRQKNRRTEIIISGDEERQKAFIILEGKRPRAVKTDLR